MLCRIPNILQAMIASKRLSFFAVMPAAMYQPENPVLQVITKRNVFRYQYHQNLRCVTG